jgi:hypothetical protein
MRASTGDDGGRPQYERGFRQCRQRGHKIMPGGRKGNSAMSRSLVLALLSIACSSPLPPVEPPSSATDASDTNAGLERTGVTELEVTHDDAACIYCMSEEGAESKDLAQLAVGSDPSECMKRAQRAVTQYAKDRCALTTEASEQGPDGFRALLFQDRRRSRLTVRVALRKGVAHVSVEQRLAGTGPRRDQIAELAERCPHDEVARVVASSVRSCLPKPRQQDR